jgi:alpha-1,3-glucosyltransferase
MYPLLKRDDLILPYFLTTILWNYVAGYHVLSMPRAVKWMSAVCYTSMIAWHLTEANIPAPANLPDIYTVLNVLFSCGCFSLAFIYFNWRQFNLLDNVPETLEEQKKKQN